MWITNKRNELINMEHIRTFKWKYGEGGVQHTLYAMTGNESVEILSYDSMMLGDVRSAVMQQIEDGIKAGEPILTIRVSDIQSAREMAAFNSMCANQFGRIVS